MTTGNINQLISLLFSTGRIIHETEDAPKGCDPLSVLRLETLRYISTRSPSMNEISTYLRTTPPSATSLVDGLVRAGQLKRISDRKDRRRVKLAVTAKGRRVLERSMKILVTNMSKTFGLLSEREIKTLILILDKIFHIYQGRSPHGKKINLKIKKNL
jgi:DNA-binding MarR family transcriptional regulator